MGLWLCGCPLDEGIRDWPDFVADGPHRRPMIGASVAVVDSRAAQRPPNE